MLLLLLLSTDEIATTGMSSAGSVSANVDPEAAITASTSPHLMEAASLTLGIIAISGGDRAIVC
ncbi:hypothetical protein PC128_g17463 [Phytophthora cactorum]|nr:hypothetical protein PC120_g15879 [Phytophthora cactorum]KAG3175963.1 hypothetical protein PC128_g17463 [Phytophthora cactorum]KAG4048651.1 hypothetical protein PC123_g16031 [Phytophthora cactorum]